MSAKMTDATILNAIKHIGKEAFRCSRRKALGQMPMLRSMQSYPFST